MSASPGDAVTDAAFEIRNLLRRAGPSEVFARYIDPQLAQQVLPLEAYTARRATRPEDDVLVFHASIGEPDVQAFLQERSERLVIAYHNIAPSAPFRRYDPTLAELLEAGRRELALLVPRTRMAIADSAYSAAELEDIGFTDVRVVPLVVDVARLRVAQPDEALVRHLAQLDGPLVLFVGQQLPHKRVDLLVSAYHVLVTYLEPNARLMLVGPTRLPRYADAIQALIEELNLPRAWMTGPVTTERLAAFYRHADVFATASEHEGFCVPLLEAMGFDVPIVARAHAAIPETLGGAGLLLPRDAGPILMAEAIAEVLRSPDVRHRITDLGRQRLDAFEPGRARAAILEHLREVG